MSIGIPHRQPIKTDAGREVTLAFAANTKFHLQGALGHVVSFENDVPYRQHKGKIFVNVIRMATGMHVMVRG
jgi:hypothetical protein